MDVGSLPHIMLLSDRVFPGKLLAFREESRHREDGRETDRQRRAPFSLFRPQKSSIGVAVAALVPERPSGL